MYNQLNKLGEYTACGLPLLVSEAMAHEMIASDSVSRIKQIDYSKIDSAEWVAFSRESRQAAKIDFRRFFEYELELKIKTLLERGKNQDL